MNKELIVLTLLAGALQGIAAESGSCKADAVRINSGDHSDSVKLVREWNPDKVIDQWGNKGGYLDGAPDSATTNHIASFWFVAGFDKGPDYVLTFESSVEISVSVYKKEYFTGKYTEPNPAGESFPIYTTPYTSLSSIQANGKHYCYVRASDWFKLDPDYVEYYIKVTSVKRGNVKETFSYSFAQKSIDDVIEATPGTLKAPIGLDVSEAGSRVIDPPPEKHPQYYRWMTAYSANLVAGERYVFTGSYPTSPDMDVNLSLADWPIPGVNCEQLSRADGHAVTGLVITTSAACTIVILTMPDDLNWRDGKLTGGTLSWRLGDDPEPVPVEPVAAGFFTGTLVDLDTETCTAVVSIVVKAMDNGTTNFTGRITIDGVDYEYADGGNSLEMVSSTRVGGKRYPSYFQVVRTPSGAQTVSGSIYLDDGGVQEFFFEGDLDGSFVSWLDSLLPYDAQSDSAADMGIVSGAFKGEPAGSETLVRAWTWGVKNNLGVSDMKSVVFSAAGDPNGTLAEAYLFDCSPSDSKTIQDGKDAFRIISFSMKNGVTVTGGKKDGDAYLNGHVEVRTSRTVDGTYDTTDKKGSSSLFYRAFLVK